jgi:HD-like signal output (HDOD) protein
MEPVRQGAPEHREEIEELERQILARIDRGALRVPPYPTVAIALRKLVSHDNYGLDEVLQLVATDASLVADVLRCANAAFFGRGTVSSLQQAVGRVGASQVTRLALVSGLSGLVRTAGPLAPLRRQAWEMSLSSAALCQTLAPMRKLSGESAFVAGLLHDFGWLIGIAAIEEMLGATPAAPARKEQFWLDAIERSHTRLGLALASRWKLPDLLRDAIGLHHETQCDSQFAPFVELVATVDRVISLLEVHPQVSAQLLESIPELTKPEREAVAHAIPQLPELVSAFDCEPQGTSLTSKLASPPLLPDGFTPFDCLLHQLSPRRRGPFTMVGLAANSFLFKGREALPEKQLVEVELKLPGTPLRMWTKVEHCVGEAGVYRIECRPFALSGEALKQWRELERKA